MAENDITAMKETLRAQQQLLQKLYAELDQEREASASAASEAMDMILRLQGEKAAVKMEASHYKRMAEEKIGHAEASLEVFEELMYQKEMEIASLEFQVVAYKHKLVTLGADFNAGDFIFPEDLLLSTRNDQQQQNEENDQISNNVRRLTSLPPIQLKNTLRGNRKRDRSPSPISKTVSPTSISKTVSPSSISKTVSPCPTSKTVSPCPIPKTVEGRDREVNLASFHVSKKATDYEGGTLDAYWNQIQSLDQKVKVCADLRSRRGKSCSLFSQGSTKIGFSDKENYCESTQESEAVASPSYSVNIHDVFEVPQTSEKHEVSEHGKKRLERWVSDVDSRLAKPDCTHEEIIETHVKHDMEKLRRNMLGTHHHHHHHEIKKTSPKDRKNIFWQKKEGVDVDSNAQAEFQMLHQRIDRLEKERISIRQEIKHEGDGEEQLRLLKDIQSQLISIHSEMRSLKPKKPLPKKEENISLGPLQEAMLYFWI